MSGLDDTLNSSMAWRPRMSRPSSFNLKRQREYQERINEICGKIDGRPIVKLAWAPDELRWRPHPMDQEPEGYTFPIFICGYDEQEQEIAAPRWVLLERLKPDQYVKHWESGRYSVEKGKVWDWKGPCPSERYTEMWCHAAHNGECCPCRGDACDCDETLDHCWGLYRDPDEGLLNRLRRAAKRIAEGAKEETVNSYQTTKDALMADVSKEAFDYWLRQPRTISTGLKRSEGGIYLLN